MKKLLFLSLFLLLSIADEVYSAKKDSVKTKFYRPSVSFVFAGQNSSASAAKFISAFQKLNMEARFNVLEINDNMFPPTLSKKPDRLDFGDNDEYQTALENHNQLYQVKLNDVARGMIGNLFGLRKNGLMTYEKIFEAANYSATDEEANIARYSANSNVIYTKIAEEMLRSTYFIVLDIKRFESPDESSGNGKKNNTWLIDAKFHVYKVNWTDSLSSVFYNTVWFDENTPANVLRERKQAFGNFRFPVEKVHTGNLMEMERMLEDFIAKIQLKVLSRSSKKVIDFRIKAPILKTRPVTAKVGSKEGLYHRMRFFAYEITSSENGKIKKRKKGVLRAKKIADNARKSDGNLPFSEFRQQGGRKLQPGMLLEMREDRGVELYGGQYIDPFNSGILFGVDFNLKQVMRRINPGEYINMPNKSSNTMGNFYMVIGPQVGLSKPLFMGDSAGPNWPKTKISTWAGGFTYHKEVYFTRKGNIFLLPEWGITWLRIKAQNSENEDEAFKFKSSAAVVGLGLGIHLSPKFMIFARAQLNYRFKDFKVMYEDSTTDAAGEEEELVPKRIRLDSEGKIYGESAIPRENRLQGAQVTSELNLNKLSARYTLPLVFGMKIKF